MNRYGHWPECETCPRTFGSQYACNQHMNDTDHWAPVFEGETCSREFSSDNARRQHMNTKSHWAPRFPCQTCSKECLSPDKAERHMRIRGHYKFYCEDCERSFEGENQLKMVSTSSSGTMLAECADNCLRSICTRRSTAGRPCRVPSARTSTVQPAACLTI